MPAKTASADIYISMVQMDRCASQPTAAEHNIYRICAQTRSSSIAINPDLVTSILQYHSTLTGHVGLHELLRRLEVAGFRDPKDKPGYLRRHCEYVLEQCALCQKIKEAKPDAQQGLSRL